MPAKIAVIYYSTYGHILTLAESVAKGLKASGAEVDIYQIPETLSDDILAKMHAGPKAAYPVIEDVNLLKNYDGFVFGIPTRYGRAAAQVSSFFDRTGGLWMSGALVGKFAATFVSTASQHGGQESTALTTIPFFTHHGIIYVPLGYIDPRLTAVAESQGGTPYGASVLAAPDGSRQANAMELSIAELQGSTFGKVVNTFVAGKAATA